MMLIIVVIINVFNEMLAPHRSSQLVWPSESHKPSLEGILKSFLWRFLANLKKDHWHCTTSLSSSQKDVRSNSPHFLPKVYSLGFKTSQTLQNSFSWTVVWAFFFKFDKNRLKEAICGYSELTIFFKKKLVKYLLKHTWKLVHFQTKLSSDNSWTF